MGNPPAETATVSLIYFITTPNLVPDIVASETLTHETLRSDHISILLDIYNKAAEVNNYAEKYLISKADWDSWQKISDKGI